jgi:hypothetical protein
MRYVIVLSVFLVACGPSALEVETRKCDDALAVNNLDAAVLHCGAALRLSPSLDKDLIAKESLAFRARALRDFEAAEAQRKRLDLIERQVDAAERAVAAAELQANMLARAESRQH